jgi:YD repeat-containing protein
MRKHLLRLAVVGSVLLLLFTGLIYHANPPQVRGAESPNTYRRSQSSVDLTPGSAILPGLPSVSSVRSSSQQASLGVVESVNCAGCDAKGEAQPVPRVFLSSNAKLGKSDIDLYSGNVMWKRTLADLPGRGLGLNLSLVYNSLVYLNDSGQLKFDVADGNPSPGFHLGLPEIATVMGSSSLLYIDSDGSTVELRPNSIGNYIAVDDSGRVLSIGGSHPILRSRNGTVLEFEQHGNRFYCSRIIDLAGNYISASYQQDGRLLGIEDTLGRTLRFSYDSTKHLVRIDRIVSGVTTKLAAFTYTRQNTLPVSRGTGGNSSPAPIAFDALATVTTANGKSIHFSYDSSGEVQKIALLAQDGTELRSQGYTYEFSQRESQMGVPRLSGLSTSYATLGGPVVSTATVAAPAADGLASVVWDDGRSTFARFAIEGWQEGLVIAQTERMPRNWKNSAVTTEKTTWAQFDDGGVLRTYRQSIISNGMSQGLPLRTFNIQFDQNGRQRSIRSLGPDGNLISSSLTEYEEGQQYNSLNVLNRVKKQVVSNSKGETREVDIYYDEKQPAAQQGVLHHLDNSPYNPQGLLALPTPYERSCVNCSAAAKYNGNAYAAYNSTGDRISFHADGGQQVAWDFSDQFEDGQASHTMAYVTSVMIGGKVYRSTYDRATGRLSGKENPDAGNFSYSYDPGGRLSVVKNLTKGIIHKRFYASDGRAVLDDEITKDGTKSTLFAREGNGRTVAISRQVAPNSSEFHATRFMFNAKGKRIGRLSSAYVDENWKVTRPNGVMERFGRPKDKSIGPATLRGTAFMHSIGSFWNRLIPSVLAQECYDSSFVVSEGEAYREDGDADFDSSDPGIDDSPADYDAWTSIADQYETEIGSDFDDAAVSEEWADETDQATTASAQGMGTTAYQELIQSEANQSSFGYLFTDSSISVTPEANNAGYTLQMDPSRAQQLFWDLQADPQFKCGIGYGFHTSAGSDMFDCRSLTGEFGYGSMQIVGSIDSGNIHVDVDSFNPYQDVVNFVGHIFTEVLPHLFGLRGIEPPGK